MGFKEKLIKQIHFFIHDEYGGIISAIVGVVGAFAQARAAKKAAAAQREQNAIATAGEKYRNKVARRRALREARIRQAQILQSASSTGVGFSSGEIGALSATSTNVAAEIGVQGAQVLTAEGMSRAAQAEANAISTAKRWNAIVGVFDSLGTLKEKFDTRIA